MSRPGLAVSAAPAAPPVAAASGGSRPSDSIVLRIADAGKSYSLRGRRSVALQPVRAEIRAREFVSLLGPSGCGKTTLLKMCAGLVQPSSGAIQFHDTGEGVAPGSYGFVFQAPALMPWKNVLGNVMLPAKILGLPQRQAHERARRLLELVHLGEATQKYPSELSGGMQQRVSIARALLHDPELLFMDEPFGALDAMTREELNLELQRIHLDQQKTVLFVTHDIEEAILLSDRILVLSRGPGRLAAEVVVPLERPRTIATRVSAEFRELALEVRAKLDDTRTGALH